MSELVFEATGTGLLGGFNRTITVPTLCQVHTAPRLPGAPVQSFDTEMFFLRARSSATLTSTCSRSGPVAASASPAPATRR
jgi:hypothetical protein